MLSRGLYAPAFKYEEKTMRTFRFELMRPEELLAEQERFSVAYLPVGPLEWHGPHMPFGTDPLDAQAVAYSIAEKLGGVVFPTLFFGTEAARSPEMVRRMGFEDDTLYVVGMDVPNNTVKSCYSPEEMFGVILRENLRLIISHGFKLVVIVNGHGADGQLATGERLANELSNMTASKVLFTRALQKLDEQDEQLGHANIAETSMQMYISGDSVDISKLPPRDVPLKTSEWGIADSLLFQGKGNKEHTVEHDPRDASAELGKRYVENGAKRISELILKTYKEL